MYLPDIKKNILRALRLEGANHFEIAEVLHEAPFRIRAELKDLRRQKLVREVLTQDEHVWKLTDLGHRVANSYDQLELA